MKVSGAIIRKVIENTPNYFVAEYKGRRIHITTDHGHGAAKYGHLTRYDITVRDIKSGMLDVETYEDLHTMRDAIRYALYGAVLLPEQSLIKK